MNNSPAYKIKGLYAGGFETTSTYDTITAFIDYLRLQKGGIRTGSVIIKGSGVGNTWINFLWMPHGTGDPYNSEERKYGTFLWNRMIDNEGKIFINHCVDGKVYDTKEFNSINAQTLSTYNAGITKEV